MNFKQKLMACTALLGVWLFHPATAGAQSADAQKIEKLERQTEMLQRQLKEIQQELARTRCRFGAHELIACLAPRADEIGNIGFDHGATYVRA